MRFEDNPGRWGYKEIVTETGTKHVVDWPEDPKEGKKFMYLCPISGCTWNFFEFKNSEWVFIKNE